MKKRSKNKYRLLLRFIPAVMILFSSAFTLISCNLKPFRTEKPQYIIFISVDTLRADHLGCYGYGRDTSPVIDSMAREGILFENTFCQRGITLPSLASIMTGKYINQHMLVDNVWSSVLKAWNVTLAEYLKETGYYNKAINANFIVTPETGIFQGFDEVTVETDGKKVTEIAVSWLNSYVSANKKKKIFLWVHYFDPHIPYKAREPYLSKFEKNYSGSVDKNFFMKDSVQVFKGNIKLEKDDIEHLNALYDSEIAETDSFIGKIIAELKKLGIYDKTLLVFFADHGEEIYEHNNYIGHFCSVYNGVLRIPLIVRYPSIISKGKRIKQVVESIDIMPTVMDLCDISSEKKVSGLSLKPLWEGKEFKNDFAVSEYWNLIFKINTGKWSYIWNPTELAPTRPELDNIKYPIGKEELYNLKLDPSEQNNIFSENPETAKIFHKKLIKWMVSALDRERWPDKKITKEGKLNKKRENALKSLGYLK